MRTLGRLTAAFALLSLACSDATAPPQPGELTIRLTTPNTTDVAAIVAVTVPTGVTLDEVIDVPADLVVFHRANGTSVRIAMFGPLTTGAVARFMVPDVRDVSRYSVQLVEVADETNTLRASLSGYAVTIAQN